MVTSRYSTLRNQQGFTLVEIAIVLAIIGVLLAGVLKGQSMIETTKLRGLYKQTQELQTAVNAYMDKYGALPGDDAKATTNLASSGCTAAQIANGDGNGMIVGTEEFTALSHLGCAGMIPGNYDGSTSTMTHKYGGTMSVYNQTLLGVAGGKLGLAVKLGNLNYEVAKAVDTNNDDGTYNKGMIRGSVDYVVANPTIATTYVFF